LLRPARARSWPSRKLAAFITATNAARPERRYPTSNASDRRAPRGQDRNTRGRDGTRGNLLPPLRHVCRVSCPSRLVLPALELARIPRLHETAESHVLQIAFLVATSLGWRVINVTNTRLETQEREARYFCERPSRWVGRTAGLRASTV
jgi:hypothetical protein